MVDNKVLRIMKRQPYATLSNGVQMPLLGLGVYDTHDAEAEAAVLTALATGYRLIDTAAMYENETEVGNAIRQSGIQRQHIFVTTKVGNDDQGYDETLKAFDVSMSKLGMEYIDLYLVHWPLKGKREATWKALEKLYHDKRVRAIGVANYLIPFLEELNRYATVIPVVNQVEFTPWLYQEELLSWCQERNVQLQSYSPVTRGRKFNDIRLQQLCRKYDKSPAQIILRWNIEHGVSVIPKSVNPQRIEENFNIFDFSLSDDDISFMDTFNENFRICDDPLIML
ncbi:MAG: aldo/keto reductase [Chitinophagaceae bacterium]|nr:aldo/keto reductase [Chitinophagaceae bacterium]